MSNQPTQVLYGAGQPMEVETSTYNCPYCHADILEANKDTHEARCARMNRDQAQRPVEQPTRQQNQLSGRQDQRSTGGLNITREHSSSSIPYPNEPTTNMRQPQIRREARRVAENKLITCANCEKSVREDDLASHQRNDCHGSDRIPCEFCDKLVGMTDYQSHIDNCPKRHEEMQQEQQSRARSLERQRQDEETLRQQQETQRRVNSAERRPAPNVQNQQQRPSQFQPQPQPQPQTQAQEQPQGESRGFMNFLKNLATIALTNRGDVEDSERPTQTQTQAQNQQRQQEEQRRQEQERQQQQQRQQQEAQGQQPGFLARLLGFHPETPEEAEQRRVQRAAQMEQMQQRQEERRRAQMQRRQQEAEMLQNLFEPRSQMMSGMMGEPQQQGSNVRTIRFGPHGSIMISSGGRGAQQRPMHGFQPAQRRNIEHEMEEMGPLGVLLSMMNGGVPGMRVVSPEELQGMSQEEQAGLAREVLDSLSIVKYEKEKNKNVSEDLKSCPICIEDFEDGDEVRYLWCMHRFHKGCVDKWLEKHSNCPICKKEYSESEVSFE